MLLFFFNRGYLPTHMNYHDMITFRLRYTCVYTLKVLPFVPYTDVVCFFKSSLFDQRGIQEHSPGLLLPYVAVSSTCGHESFKVGLHREARHELLFFFLSSHCLTTVMLHVYNVSEWSKSLKTKSSSETRHEHFVILLFDHRYTINVIMIFEACQMWNH